MKKFTQYAKEVEDSRFKVEETFVENVLTKYEVTYNFAGKTISETVDVAGLSKRTSAKKLEDAKKTLKAKMPAIFESNDNQAVDILRNDFQRFVFPQSWHFDATLATPEEIYGAVLFMKNCDPSKVQAYLNQAEDNLATAKKLDQKNRVADLEIRISMAKLALSMTGLINNFDKK
jgi:hypothetical protein